MAGGISVHCNNFFHLFAAIFSSASFKDFMRDSFSLSLALRSSFSLIVLLLLFLRLSMSEIYFSLSLAMETLTYNKETVNNLFRDKL